MEESDVALFQKLTELGCVFPVKVENLKELPHIYVLPIAQKCLDRINGEDEDTVIPEGKGDQVLLASKLAAACKDLGYENELGYDLFLYPNEQDLRAVLTFLLNKLSIEYKPEITVDTKDLSLMQKISQKLREELEKPWVPVYCKAKSYSVYSNGTWTNDGCRYTEPFQTTPFVITRDTKNILEGLVGYWKMNAHGGINYLIDNSENTVETSMRADLILKKLKSKGAFNFNTLNSYISDDLNIQKTQKNNENDDIDIDIENLNIDVLHGKNERGVILKSLFANEEINKDKIKTLEEKLNSNIRELKEKIKIEKQTVASYEKEIQEHKLQVEDEELDVLEKKIKKKAQKLKKVKRNRTHLITSPDKDRLVRSNDIIETIDRLTRIKADMNNMISNINVIQKDINRINGVLDRSFVVADEMIFKDAKKDEFARKTYKLVANVHTECNELCNMVKEIGAFTRDTVVLEKNVETAMRKNTKENLERATADLLNFTRKESERK